MIKMDEKDRKLLTLWAADCAEHVLSLFEDSCPGDNRPRKAIAAARAWALGKMKMTELRKLAFAAHAAARDAMKPESIAAARSAAHAAAVAHVANHASAVALYALKAVMQAGKSTDEEREWQLAQLKKLSTEIVEIVLTHLNKKEPGWRIE